MPAELRTWQLCQVLHGPPSSWEHMPAMLLDRILAVDSAITKGKNNVQERANRG